MRTARPEQITPTGDWAAWLILAGRGYGKTRTGAEDAAEYARLQPGTRQALVAATFADGRDTMVEGESGLLAVIPNQALRGGSQDTAWNRSMGELYLENGSRFKIYSSEKPRALRGPQHHRAWCDELAAWKDAPSGDTDDTTWANLMLGLRLGDDPRVVITTTPKPNRLIRDLVKRDDVLVTRGSTYDNLDNLAPPFRKRILSRYEGTRLGRQELNAELLEDVPGALWTLQMVDAANKLRLDHGPDEYVPDLIRAVVAVDPAVTSGDDSDMTGIIVAGLGADGDAYVLADRTCKVSPKQWARRAVAAYDEFLADMVVAEVNNGGDLVGEVIWNDTPTVPYRQVHASRGKRIRAEPVSMLYEQGHVHHLGVFDELEEQLTTWTPESGESPDRLDALVWALTELMIDPGGDVDEVIDDTERVSISPI